MPKFTQPPGQAHSGERQQAVSGNNLDHPAIRAGTQCWETASSQWQSLRPLSYQGRPSVVRDSKQSVAMPKITQPPGQAHSGERQQAVSGNTLDHPAIRAGTQCWETASSQWQCLGPRGFQCRPWVVRQFEVSGNGLDPRISGRPSVVRDKEQSVAKP